MSPLLSKNALKGGLPPPTTFLLRPFDDPAEALFPNQLPASLATDFPFQSERSLDGLDSCRCLVRLLRLCVRRLERPAHWRFDGATVESCPPSESISSSGSDAWRVVFQGDDIMRTRTILSTAATLAVGAILGLLATALPHIADGVIL